MIKPLRGEVYWTLLDPVIGSEIMKKGPALIISNNILNLTCPRVIVAPITSKASRIFRFEAPISLKGREGKILLDQIRSIDKIRLDGKIGECDEETMEFVAEALRSVFTI